MPLRPFPMVLMLAAAVGLTGCPPTGPSLAARRGHPIVAPGTGEDAPRDYPGLANVVAYHDGLYSGGAPDGRAGFDALAGLGVRTIISVDGAIPDVAAAEARGMRYVHLPVGYDGFDRERRLQLARAARDALETGPVYVHCHHGRHRSASAAASIGVTLGWASPGAMIDRMRVSGTSPHYAGLFETVRAAAPVALAVLDEVPGDLPSIERPSGIVASMVECETIVGRLEAIEDAGWRTPPDHPDLVPAAEAGRLADVLRYLREGEAARSRPAGFRDRLRDGAALAARLEAMLVGDSSSPAELSAGLASITETCRACHVRHRDEAIRR